MRSVTPDELQRLKARVEELEHFEKDYRQLKTEMKDNADFYQSLFEQSADGIFVRDRRGQYIRVNDRGCQMLGFPREKILQHHPRELFLQGNPSLQPRYLDEMQAGTALITEQTLLRKDGTQLIVEISAQQLPDGCRLEIFRDCTARKELKEQQWNEKEHFLAIFQSAQIAFALSSLPNRVLVDVNGEFERVFGWKKEEAIGKTISELGIVPDSQLRENLLNQVKLQGYVHHQKLAFHNKAGNPIIILGNIDQVTIAEEKYILSTFENITEREEVAEELRKSEELYRSLFEHMLNGFAYCKMISSGESPQDFIYLNVNRAFETLTGLKDVIGKRVSEVIPGIRESDPELIETYGRVSQTGRPEVFETYVEALKMWFSVSVYSPARGFFVAVFDVITERKLTEAQRREDEARIHLALDAAKGGTWEWNLRTNENIWSEELWKVYGLEPLSCEPSYEVWLQTVHPDDRETASQLVQKAARESTELNAEWRVRDRDGTERWLMSRGRPIFDAGGRADRYIGIVLDITTQKKLEISLANQRDELRLTNEHLAHEFEELTRAEDEIRRLNIDLERKVHERTAQLESANKELEAFSYSVSHDLRAPLRGIDGWSHALLDEYQHALDEQGNMYLERVRSETRRMGRLIDDLLQLSRVTHTGMQFSPVDLSGIAQTIINRLQTEQPNRMVDMVIQPDLVAEGDASLLTIVLTNLLDNAWKFTGKTLQSRIEFGQTALTDSGVFYVRDNGAGFDMAYADQLFGPFQRLHRATDFPGTGIGLATVQRIILRHNGRVWAKAEPDNGATFFFTIGEEY